MPSRLPLVATFLLLAPCCGLDRGEPRNHSAQHPPSTPVRPLTKADLLRLPDPPPQHGIIHERWRALGVPQAGITLILNDSDEHGFFANYRGVTPDKLLDRVSSRIEAAGYKQVCTAFDGLVRGFRRGDDELAVKIDLL